MQLRCSYCQTMFAISREETLAALEHMADNNLKYYDAHCPNCRRANRVERIKLEASYPGWQTDIKKMVKEADKAEAEVKQEAAAVKAPAAEKTAKKTIAANPPVKKKGGLKETTAKGKKK